MKKNNLLFAASACAFTVVPAMAAQPEAADSVISLKDIEVVANRASAKTPVAFSNVNKSEIQKVNDGRDIPYLLSMTPSLITTSDAGAGMGYTSLRVRGTDGSRINVTANGIPINDAESHNVYWVNMPDFASSLRDIQIQRGAGTSTNGAGAFGASINMVTDAPSTEPYAEVAGSYGMYNTHKETLRVGSGLLGGHWTVDARLSNLGSDGYIDRASSNLWSYFGQLGYVGGSTSVRLLAFGGKEKTYMAWDYASKEEMEENGRTYNPCGKYTDSEGNTAYYKNQNDNYTQHHFQLHLGQGLGEYWRLNVALHYTKGDGYYEQYKTKRTLAEYGLEPFYLDGEKVKKSDLVRLKNMDNGFGGGVFALNYNHDGIDATIGGGIQNYKGDHFGQIAWVRNYVGSIDPLQEYYRNTGEKFDGNIYARANVDLSAGFSAYGDLQYRHIDYRITGENDTYDYNTGAMQALNFHEVYNFFNPKVGFNWQRDGHRAYISFSVAHKEPVRDNFTDGDANNMPSPERLFDYELGYTYNSKIFSAGANFFYMDYKDQLVVTGQLSDTGNALSVNVPDSYRMGVELQAAVRPCTFFDWNINATLSRNRIKNFVEYIYEDEWTNPISFELGDTPIAFSPDFTLNNAFNFHWAGFDATLTSQYVSKQYMTNGRNDEQALDAYFVNNLHLGYTFKNIAGAKRLHLGFSIYNIFNEKYENNGYAGSGYYVGDNGEKVIYRYSGYAAQAPTNVMGSISLAF
jgi:iron complex outermembrane receptor protein